MLGYDGGVYSYASFGAHSGTFTEIAALTVWELHAQRFLRNLS